jgi:hypothetical protein
MLYPAELPAPGGSQRWRQVTGTAVDSATERLLGEQPRIGLAVGGG